MGLILLLIQQLSCLDTHESIKKQLQQSRFNEAYKSSNSLINSKGILDSEPELFYFRGKAAYHIGKYQECINDISRYLGSGNKEYQKEGYETRCNAYIKIGDFDDAKIDAENSNSERAKRSLRNIQILRSAAENNENSSNYKTALAKYQEMLKICSSAPVIYGKAALLAEKLGNSTLFLDLSKKGLSLAPKNAFILEILGKHYLLDGNFVMAQKHLKYCISVASNPSKCTILLKASNNFQTNQKHASEEITKKNFNLVDKYIKECDNIVNKLNATGTGLDCLIKGLKVKVFIANGKKTDAVKYMNDLIKNEPNNYKLLFQRAELLKDIGDYDGALKDLYVIKKNRNSQKVVKMIEQISDLQEKEKNVDYYTLLGVKRDADQKEIKDAYRKLVIKWHPDRYKDPVAKKEAEKKMKMINKAYDVISDKEKRRMYDLGQDPENPGAGANFEQGNFQGGFPGFGGGGFPGFMFGGFDDILRQMMNGGGGGGFQFTVNGKKVNPNNFRFTEKKKKR